jgi:hypothetical protein
MYVSSAKSPMDKEKLKSTIKTLVNDREALRLLKENPEQAATRLQLSSEEARALKSADLLIAARIPAVLGGTNATKAFPIEPPDLPDGGNITTTFTFVTGSTI